MIPKIKKIAKDIYKELGSCHQECVYQKAFEVALRLERIAYENQKIVPIFYKKYNVGEGKPDLIINDGKGKVIIELKSIGAKLSNKEKMQLKKYMDTLKIKKGVLINFPAPGCTKTPNEPEIIVV